MLWDFYSIVFSCKHLACHITDFLSYAKFNCHKSSIFNVSCYALRNIKWISQLRCNTLWYFKPKPLISSANFRTNCFRSIGWNSSSGNRASFLYKNFVSLIAGGCLGTGFGDGGEALWSRRWPCRKPSACRSVLSARCGSWTYPACLCLFLSKSPPERFHTTAP